MKEGLEPLIDHNTKVLILGSLPSDISINKQQYYANPTNDFWRIMSVVLNKQLPEDYSGRTKMLLQYSIGLWDVYHACERQGSMDKNIIYRQENDFENLRKNYPHLTRICLNGKEAGSAENLFLSRGFEVKTIPSSSGANRRDQQERIRAWKDVLA